MKARVITTVIVTTSLLVGTDIAAREQPKQSSRRTQLTEQVDITSAPARRTRVQKHESAEDLWGKTPAKQRAGLWDFLRKNLLPLSGLLLVIGLITFGNSLRRGEKHKATGRMATPQEELAQYGYGWGKGGFMLGRQILKGRLGIERTGQVLRLMPEQRLSHTLIEAGPGAGKTTGLFIPQLLEDSASSLFSAYIVDRKSIEPVLSAMSILNHRIKSQ